MINVTTKIIHEINERELEEYIEFVYGHEFYIGADQEAGHDDVLSFYVNNKPLDKYARIDINTFKQLGVGEYILPSIMQDLYLKGHLPYEGEYIVRLS